MPDDEFAGADDINLADPLTFTEPGVDRIWETLRREQPVYLHPETEFGPQFWVLTRYQDVLAAYKDPRLSSQRGNMLTSLLAGGDAAGGKLLAVMDAPRHSAVRAMLLKSFSPRMLAPVVAGIRAHAEELVNRFVEADSGDFAADVADVLPMRTICDLLGVPAADRAHLLGLSKRALSSEWADQSAEQVRVARNELLYYFTEFVRTRRECAPAGSDDVIGALLSCRIDGVPLTDEEVVLNCYGLVLAGDETARLATIGAVWSFARHPAQWHALRRGEVTVSGAVEELLRWTTPAMHVGRTASADIELHGRCIRRGDVVTLWNASANRDERVFTDPERFDLARSPNRHLTFGHGPHFCLGAYLGRSEITAVIDALSRKVDGFELTAHPRPLFSTFLRGYSTMPVAVRPGRRG